MANGSAVPNGSAVNGGPKVNGCGRKDCCQLNGSASPADVDAFPLLDLKPYVPGTELLFPPSLSKHVARPIAYGNAKRLWVKPSTLDELLRIKAAYPSAKLVGGSSEVQIEIKFKSAPYDVCVYAGDLPELQQVELPSASSPKLVFGGNLPLIEIERLCERLYKDLGEGKASALEAIRHQLRYFAGRQIRNVASAAGNIATASPISDLNPVLLAVGATVVVASEKHGETRLPIDGFFVGYRKTTLPPDAVIVKVEVPLDVGEGEKELVKSYKQARRKDDDIAIVTAGFNVRVDGKGIVTVARLAYGGMACASSSSGSDRRLTAKQADDAAGQKSIAVPRRQGPRFESDSRRHNGRAAQGL